MQVYQQQMKSIKDKFPKRFLNNEAIGKQYKTIKKEINKDDLIYRISYKKVLRHLRRYDFLKKLSWMLMELFSRTQISNQFMSKTMIVILD